MYRALTCLILCLLGPAAAPLARAASQADSEKELAEAEDRYQQAVAKTKPSKAASRELYDETVKPARAKALGASAPAGPRATPPPFGTTVARDRFKGKFTRLAGTQPARAFAPGAQPSTALPSGKGAAPAVAEEPIDGAQFSRDLKFEGGETPPAVRPKAKRRH